jgi:dipeptidyl aminopeptidase/acylaminoacyl peptidase
MSREGVDSLVHIRGPGRPLAVLAQPCVSISAVSGHGAGVAFIGGTPESAPEVWVLDAVPGGQARTVRRAPPDPPGLSAEDISAGEPFSLRGRSGRPVHGIVYPPVLAGTEGPAQGAPPLVVWCHGGPTAAAVPGLDVAVQYFTSRGFAVAAVNYAGSTGYGRAYRTALWGQWGVADAEDCLDAAIHLAAQGRVNADRMAIRGGSAGGLTALNALAAGEGFAAAVSWYGVTDLLGLAASTHDFEARYMDRLVGPLPECRELYLARSPVERAADINGSVLLLQGTEDPVVPPAQAERLRDALLALGKHCRVRFFEGESHGFRRAETLVACLEEELAFYRAELHL